MKNQNKGKVVQLVPKHGEVVRPPQERTDGWQNVITGLGTALDKRKASELNWEYRPPEFYEQLYSGGGIPARIVDLIPEECLRRGWDWTGVDNGVKKVCDERAERLDLRGGFLKAWKWGRAYGGGCLHIVTDTKDPSAPLEIGKERVLALRDLSRWDLRILTTDIEYDFGSPNFGHPRIYYLNVQMGSQYKGYPIHWTRMIRFDGQLVPRRTYIRNGYWHDSVLNRIYNSIRNYETSNDSAAAALQDFNVDVYKLKNLANLIQAGHEDVVRSRVEMMNLSKSVLNAMILDADNEDYDNKGRSLEGVAELLDHQANRLVADTDIPHTKLLGESPDGSNATGNSTSQQFYNFLDAERENYAKPKFLRLLEVVYPEFEGKLGFKFRPLRVLDDVETANLRKTQSETDKNYVDMGALDPTEITESRFGGDEWSMDTKIDKEAREAGLIGPGSNEFPGGEGEEPEEGEEGSEGDPGPSAPETKGNKQKPGDKNADLKGRKKEALDAEQAQTSSQEGMGQSEFGLRNEELPMQGAIAPKTQSFISQTESLPFRDPATDPQIKGPGIPNKARTFLPTRGNGVTAQSGFDFQLDAGSKGVAREGLHADAAEIPRVAKVIVKRGDQFLMGKRKDNGRWCLPGGYVEDAESMHGGAVRELHEETGIPAKKLKFLGSRLVEPEQGKSLQVSLYQHHHKESDWPKKPNGRKDPDQEFSEFRWLNSKEPLPEEISGALHSPNDVGLVHLGLLK